MDKLTVDDMDVFAEHDPVTEEQMAQLLRRARLDPHIWMVIPGLAAYEGEPMKPIMQDFRHKPSGKSYGFGYAVLNKHWYKLAEVERVREAERRPQT